MTETGLDPEENRLYQRAEDLHPSHWERLGRRNPTDGARETGALWDGEAYTLGMLGRTVRVWPRARKIRFADRPRRVPGYQRALVAVAYLTSAIDVPPRGQWVTPRELPGGDAFFRGPHAVATEKVAARFGARPDGLVGAAAELGGIRVEGGDAAVEILALPRVPLRVLLWGTTEEFGASATLLSDSRAHMHAALDVLWALTNVLIADLVRKEAP